MDAGIHHLLKAFRFVQFKRNIDYYADRFFKSRSCSLRLAGQFRSSDTNPSPQASEHFRLVGRTSFTPPAALLDRA